MQYLFYACSEELSSPWPSTEPKCMDLLFWIKLCNSTRQRNNCDVNAHVTYYNQKHSQSKFTHFRLVSLIIFLFLHSKSSRHLLDDSLIDDHHNNHDLHREFVLLNHFFYHWDIDTPNPFKVYLQSLPKLLSKISISQLIDL